MAERVPVGEWRGNTFEATDGREFTIFSEHVRGEPRFYYARERASGAEWAALPFDGAYRRNQVRRRVERYVRETLREANDG